MHFTRFPRRGDGMIVFLYNFPTAMLVSSDAFGDAVREVYEPEWPGRDKLIQYLEVCDQKRL